MDPAGAAALVDRLTVRLASATDASLGPVLETLLPQLLQLLGFPDAGVRAKVMGLVTHVHTRVKALPSVHLPVPKILALWSAAVLNSASPFIVNFSSMFLKVGYERAGPADKAALLPPLVRSLARHTRDNQTGLLGMVLQGVVSRTDQYTARTFEAPAAKGDTGSGIPAEDFLYQFHRPGAPEAASLNADASVVVEHLCRVMMYPAGTALTSKTPPGLSPVDVRMVLNGRTEGLSTADVLPVKLAIIRFLKAHLQRQFEAKQQAADQHRWLAGKALRLAIAAACDAHHEVAAAGDTLLKQFVEPAVDLEDLPTLPPLYDILLGNAPLPTGQLRSPAALTATAAPAPSIELQRSPAPMAMQLKALAMVGRSLAAVQRCWPANYFVLQRTLTDADPKRRLLPGGLQLLLRALHAPASPSPSSCELAAWAGDLASLLVDVLRTGQRDAGGAGAEGHAARGSLYVALGTLCQRCPAVAGPQSGMLEFFFEALQQDASGLRSNLQEGLANVCVGMWPLSPDAESRYTRLLLSYASEDQPAAMHLAAVQCANRLLGFTVAPARLICLLLCGRPSAEVREECGKGLRLEAFRQQKARFLSLAQTPVADRPSREELLGPHRLTVEHYPAFETFMPYVCSHFGFSADSAAAAAVPLPTLAAVVRFTFACLLHSATRAVAAPDLPDRHAAALGAYLATADNAALEQFHAVLGLCLRRTTDAAVGAYVSLDAALNPTHNLGSQSPQSRDEDRLLIPVLVVAHLVQASPACRRRYAEQHHVDLFCKLLIKGPKAIREAAGCVLGSLASALDPTVRAGLLRTLTAIQDTVVGTPQMATLSHAPELEALHGAVLGYAELLAGAPVDPVLRPLHASQVARWGSLLRYHSAPVVAAAVGALGLAGKCGALSAILGDEAADAAEDPSPTVPLVSVPAVLRALLDMVKTHPNSRTVEHAIRSLGLVAMGLPAGRPLEQLTDGLFGIVVARLTAVTAMAKKDKKGETPTGETGGYQGEETQFTFGEAVACVMGGSVAEGRRDFAVIVARRLLSEYVVHPVPAIRRASAIWLLCIVQLLGTPLRGTRSTSDDEDRERTLGTEYPLEWGDFQPLTLRRELPRGHPCVTSFLKDYQRAFQFLLTDANEVTQEAASKGLTLVYGMGDKGTQAQLVDSLVHMLNGGKTTLEPKITPDTELFPADFIGKPPSSSGVGNLSTYRDVCSLATEMGRPDLVYQFMALASHHSLWNSRRAAAFGVAHVLRTNLEAIRPQLAAVLPKLYRNRFDPNAKIAEAMQAMWDSLLPGLQEARAAVDENLVAIAAEVVAGLNHHQYRIREASCQALVDLLGGRSWGALGDPVAMALPMLFRVMDDVKETTVAAARSCGKAVAAFIAKSCTPQYSTEAQIQDCLRRTLPVICEQGFNSPCPDVALYAAQLLQRVCHVGGPLLRPYVPDIVALCLEYKSVVEPRELQYLQNLGDASLTEEQIEAARLHLSGASPLSEALKSCQPLCDADVFVTLMPRLIELLRSGVGLPTRAATAHFIGLAAKFHAPAIAPHVPALLRTATLVLRHERSHAVKGALATALGLVFREAPAAAAERLLADLVAAYLGEEGHDDSDDGIRVTTGLVLREVNALSGDKLREVLPTVMPVAFLALRDPNERAAEAWGEVWRSHSGGDREGVNRHYPAILRLLPGFLQHASWKKRAQAAEALHAICRQRHADQPLLLEAVHQLLVDALGRGRLWAGKERLCDALAAFFEDCCPATSSSAAPASGGTAWAGLLPKLEEAITLIAKECGRPKKAYRLRAHRALVVLLKALFQHRPTGGPLPDTEVPRRVLGRLLEDLEGSAVTAAADDDDGDDDGEAAAGLQPRNGSTSGVQADVTGQRLQALCPAFRCVYPTAAAVREGEDVPALAGRVLAALGRHLEAGATVATQLVVLRAAEGVFSHCDAVGQLSAPLFSSPAAALLLGLAVHRLEPLVDREVRLAALHTVGTVASLAAQRGSSAVLPSPIPRLEAMAAEQDTAVAEGAKRFLEKLAGATFLPVP